MATESPREPLQVNMADFSFTVIGSILLTIGSLTLLLVILVKQELRRNCTNWLVITALVHLIIVGAILRPYMAAWMYTHTVFETTCFFRHFIIYYPLIPLLLICIALDQVLLNFFPHKYPQKKVVIGLIVFCMVFSLVFSFMVIFCVSTPRVGYNHWVRHEGYEEEYCTESGNGRRGNKPMNASIAGISYIAQFILLCCLLLPFCCKGKFESQESGASTNAPGTRNSLILVLVTFLVYFLMTCGYNFGMVPHLGTEDREVFKHSVALKGFHYIYCSFYTVLPWMWMVLLADVRAVLCTPCCAKCCVQGSTGEQLRLVNNSEASESVSTVVPDPESP